MGVLDAGEAIAHTRREQRRAAVRRVDVHPQLAVAANARYAREIVDQSGVGRTRCRDDCAHRRRVAVGRERGLERVAGEMGVDRRHDERVDVNDAQRVHNRRVRLLAHRDP